jgi:hypothetical protein
MKNPPNPRFPNPAPHLHRDFTQGSGRLMGWRGFGALAHGGATGTHYDRQPAGLECVRGDVRGFSEEFEGGIFWRAVPTLPFFQSRQPPGF